MVSKEVSRINLKTRIAGVIIGITLFGAVSLVALSIAISRGEIVLNLDPIDNPYDRARRLYHKGHYVRALNTLAKLEPIDAYSDSKQDYDALILKASIKYALGSYSEALEAYRSVINSPFLDVSLYYDIGITYMKLGIFDEAVNYLEQSVSLDMGNVDTLKALGKFYYDRSLYRLAKGYYTKAIDVEYENEEARLYLGLIALKEKNSMDAYSVFASLLDAEDPYIGAAASALLGDKHLEENDVDTAKQMYLRSLAYDIEQPDVAVSLADLYAKNGDHDGVINIYENIVRTDPNNPDALETLGNMYVKKDDYKKAAYYYKRLYNTGSNPYKSSFLLASSLYKIEEYNEALKYYKKVIYDERVGESHINSLFCVGEIYNAKKSYKNALSYYDRYLNLSDNDSLAYNRMGTIYLTTEEYDLAETALRKAWELDNSDASSLLLLAQYYNNIGEEEVSFDTYKEIEKYHPTNISVLFALGHLYLTHKDNTDTSINYLLNVADNTENPNVLRSEAFLTLAGIYETLSDDRNTITYYEKSINLHGTSDNCYAYGKYLSKTGKHENAILVFQKSLEFKPDRQKSSEIGLALGIAYDNINNRAMAERAYSYAVKNNRKNLEAVSRLEYIKSLR